MPMFLSPPRWISMAIHTARPSPYCPRPTTPPNGVRGREGSDVVWSLTHPQRGRCSGAGKGGVGDTTAGEMRRAGIQLNGAQRRDLALLPSLPFFTPQLPTGTGESILGDDLSRSKTRIKWPYIPGGTECLCFCPHHVDPYGHTARPSSRNGAQGRGLPFFLSFALLFAF